jgi:hypothetical protein
MAKDELSFQAELLDDARRVGCNALRTADRFHVGRPDCYIKHPAFEYGAWIELKFLRSAGVKLGLTELQRRELRREQGAGGVAGWACCLVVTPGRLWRLYASVDTHATHINDLHFVGERKHGGKWPVHELMGKLYNERSGQNLG